MSLSGIDPGGPLFLSYRQHDGIELVTRVADLLRSAGIPVWRDRDDLPPGDTTDRLEQAIDDGISGAVLIITDDIANSDVVRGIEAPRLIDLHRNEPRFQLSIVNALPRDNSGGMNYAGPDRALGRVRKELAGVLQVSPSEADLLALTQKAVWHRISHLKDRINADGYFSLTLQTRNIGQVQDRTDAQLDIRVRPSQHERLPNLEGLKDLQQTLRLLPDAITRTGASRVRVSGGAHLSVAFAVGAALPSSRIGELTAVDQFGAPWSAMPDESPPAEPYTVVAATETEGHRDGRPAVAVYVDLLPTPSNAAFDRYLQEHESEISAFAVVGCRTRGRLKPAEVGTVIAEVTDAIRLLSAEHSNARVELLLRTPFPIALLLGASCNTLRVRLYEWDDSDDSVGLNGDWRPRYVPCLDVHPTNPTGPIVSVLAVAT